MASQADLLGTLPPELRQCVYSHLFFGDGDGTVQVGYKSRSDYFPSAILALPEDPLYVKRFWESPGNSQWPKETDEAFFRALRWINVEHPWSREKVNGRSRNDLVSGLIYELTGQMKCRKTVSRHIQDQKGFLDRWRTTDRQYKHREQACGVPNSGSPVLDGNPMIFTQNSNGPASFASILKEFPSPCRSLSLVNHFYRTECIDYLASHTRHQRFDFGLDRHAFQRFCSAAPADLIVSMRHARITMVEGYMPPLPHWPELRTLQIDLWPRNPARPEVMDREWGSQTKGLLARLGVTLAVRARITLEMRWVADCERFEREYVKKGRWRQAVVDEGDGVVGRQESFRRTVYETCGDWKTIVEATERADELASWLGGFML